MFLAEMAYCGPLGLPHSQFLRWSPDDQDKAIAWTIHKGERCQRCGTVPEDWLDEDKYPLEPPPYVATTRKCLGCAMLKDEREAIPSGDREIITAYLIKNNQREVPEWKRLSP